jgi:hypothetical protein
MSFSSINEVIDRYLDKGIVMGQCCDICPVCDYVFGSVETMSKYYEAIGGPKQGCCFSYYCNEEDWNSLKEVYPIFEYYDTNQNGEYIQKSKCNNGNFENCLNRVKNIYAAAGLESSFKERGIIENERLFDNSAICMFLDLYEETGITDPLRTVEYLDRIFDKGVVISCSSQNFLTIASVETYLKFAEAVGYTITAQQVP